jgi:hypothetical protein
MATAGGRLPVAAFDPSHEDPSELLVGQCLPMRFGHRVRSVGHGSKVNVRSGHVPCSPSLPGTSLAQTGTGASRRRSLTSPVAGSGATAMSTRVASPLCRSRLTLSALCSATHRFRRSAQCSGPAPTEGWRYGGHRGAECAIVSLSAVKPLGLLRSLWPHF